MTSISTRSQLECTPNVLLHDNRTSASFRPVVRSSSVNLSSSGSQTRIQATLLVDRSLVQTLFVVERLERDVSSFSRSNTANWPSR